MKNWNKTGKIKAIILGLLALPNLLFPIGSQGQEGLIMILMPFIFGSIAIPFIVKLNQIILRREIIKPTWNDNPLTLKRPLIPIQFWSYFFLTAGTSTLLGSGIKFHAINFFGLFLISFGLGILTGIWVILKLTKSK